MIREVQNTLRLTTYEKMDYEEKMTEEELRYEYFMSGAAERDIAHFEEFVREHSAEEIELMIRDDPIMCEWYDRHASGASVRALRRFMEEYNEYLEEMDSLPGKRAAGGFVEPYPKRQCVSA